MHERAADLEGKVVIEDGVRSWIGYMLCYLSGHRESVRRFSVTCTKVVELWWRKNF